MERRNRTIHARMRDYLYTLTHMEELKTSIDSHWRRRCFKCKNTEERTMRETELLIPAGSLDVLKTAVIYGADAVYLGGEAFSLRAKAQKFYE